MRYDVVKINNTRQCLQQSRHNETYCIHTYLPYYNGSKFKRINLWVTLRLYNTPVFRTFFCIITSERGQISYYGRHITYIHYFLYFPHCAFSKCKICKEFGERRSKLRLDTTNLTRIKHRCSNNTTSGLFIYKLPFDFPENTEFSYRISLKKTISDIFSVCNGIYSSLVYQPYL